jgi:hypothetical protein
MIDYKTIKGDIKLWLCTGKGGAKKRINAKRLKTPKAAALYAEKTGLERPIVVTGLLTHAETKPVFRLERPGFEQFLLDQTIKVAAKHLEAYRARMEGDEKAKAQMEDLFLCFCALNKEAAKVSTELAGAVYRAWSDGAFLPVKIIV